MTLCVGLSAKLRAHMHQSRRFISIDHFAPVSNLSCVQIMGSFYSSTSTIAFKFEYCIAPLSIFMCSWTYLYKSLFKSVLHFLVSYVACRWHNNDSWTPKEYKHSFEFLDIWATIHTCIKLKVQYVKHGLWIIRAYKQPSSSVCHEHMGFIVRRYLEILGNCTRDLSIFAH